MNHKVCHLQAKPTFGYHTHMQQIDKSYDDSTVKFKLLVGNAVSANLEDTSLLPLGQEVLDLVRKSGWVSDEFEHLWRRDGGGSAALTSHGVLCALPTAG